MCQTYHTSGCNADSAGQELICHGQEPDSASLFQAGHKLAILGDVTVLVQQVGSRHADVVKAQFGVVDTVQAHLVTHVLHSDARNGLDIKKDEHCWLLPS